MFRLAVLAAAVACATTGALAQTTNITIFHVNPDVYGSAPINMDIADIRGDAFFDLRSVLSPMECRDPNARSSDCSNPEVTARDLVITKLVLEIDPYYGEYAFCNVCVNGSAGISGHCDVEGAYVCKCGHGPQPPYPGNVGYRCWGNRCFESHNSNENRTECEANCKGTGDAPSSTPPADLVTALDRLALERMQQPSPGGVCNMSVGKVDIKQFFNRQCRQGSPNYECWRDAVAEKTGGTWYSTLKEGYCGPDKTPSLANNCTWRVAEVVKVINKTCSDHSIYNAVEAYDTTSAGTQCFKKDGCATGLARNTSSDCWITCFYNTLLGPDAGTPGGSISGMPIDDIVGAWTKPFAETDPSVGGCPPFKHN